MKQNPFRLGSKLYKVFKFMADGNKHSLRDIAKALDSGAYMCVFPSCNVCMLSRRQFASTLRRIRATRGLDVLWDKSTYTYRMTEDV